jgi:uncharacterized protein YdhG (YjbR/CyaY superfamily)
MNPVNQYIDQFAPEIGQRLTQIRELVKTAYPEAVESISYGMPAYKLDKKPLVYFAGYEKHIGIYALPFTHQQFANELAGFKQGKGSVQFPNSQELPLELIQKMIAFRAREIRSN